MDEHEDPLPAMRVYGIPGDSNDADALYAQQLGKANAHRRCSNSRETGCRCRDHSRFAELTILTMDGEQPLPDPCDGGYLCECPKCVAVKVAPIRRDVRQPWDTRQARAA